MLIDDLINNKPDLANLLKGMPSEIRKKCKVKKFAAKTVIVKKDEKPTDIYLICSGALRIFNEFENGRILQTAYLTEMDYIGLLEILASKDKIAATVEAVTECITLKFSEKDFLKWMEKDHHLAIMIARKMATDFYNVSYSNGRLLLNSAMYTLVSFIIDSVKIDIEQGKVALIKKKRQQIADELGISLRTVHRNIKKLKELGIISIESGKIYVNNDQFKMLIDKLDELVK